MEISRARVHALDTVDPVAAHGALGPPAVVPLGAALAQAQLWRREGGRAAVITGVCIERDALLLSVRSGAHASRGGEGGRISAGARGRRARGDRFAVPQGTRHRRRPPPRSSVPPLRDPPLQSIATGARGLLQRLHCPLRPPQRPELPSRHPPRPPRPLRRGPLAAQATSAGRVGTRAHHHAWAVARWAAR